MDPTLHLLRARHERGKISDGAQNFAPWTAPFALTRAVTLAAGTMLPTVDIGTGANEAFISAPAILAVAPAVAARAMCAAVHVRTRSSLTLVATPTLLTFTGALLAETVISAHDVVALGQLNVAVGAGPACGALAFSTGTFTIGTAVHTRARICFALRTREAVLARACAFIASAHVSTADADAQIWRCFAVRPSKAVPADASATLIYIVTRRALRTRTMIAAVDTKARIVLTDVTLPAVIALADSRATTALLAMAMNSTLQA